LLDPAVALLIHQNVQAPAPARCAFSGELITDPAKSEERQSQLV
jgi:hypothetical protein